MKRIDLFVIAVAMAGLGLAGCASSPPGDAAPPADRTCVRVQQINSYEVIDDHHVVIKASASKRYLLTLEASCTGLSFARGISIVETATRVCNDGFSWLAFEHSGHGTRRCRIVDLEAVDDDKAARALVESRTRE
jgi:hypothetical protein